MNMILDHSVCLSCGAVRDKFVRVPVSIAPEVGMEAGDHPYPLVITEAFAKELSASALCRACLRMSSFQLALRPMEDES